MLDDGADVASSPPPKRRLRTGLLVAVGAALVMWICVRRIGLAPHDIALVYAVGAYALSQRGAANTKGPLLGESEPRVQVRWGDFVCEQHQLLSCFVRQRGDRSRWQNSLALAVSTLALLFWKAFFRTKVVLGSIDGLKASAWTLLVSKGVQLLLKRLIRLAARWTARQNEGIGVLEGVQFVWRILQYWVMGFMALCVTLFVLEGRAWPRLLSNWLVNMAFALVVVRRAIREFCAAKIAPRPRKLHRAAALTPAGLPRLCRWTSSCATSSFGFSTPTSPSDEWSAASRRRPPSSSAEAAALSVRACLYCRLRYW